MKPRYIALGLVATLALGLGLFFTLVPPPRQLSVIDGLLGGGSGTEEIAEGVAFGTHGQRLNIWKPSDAGADEKLPVLIFWYGGGWADGSRQDYAFAARAFARAGFLVVLPDYRKVPKIRFPAFVEDGADAVAWTRDHIAEYGGDPDRIALAGHSAGAHIAALVALDKSRLNAVNVDPDVVKAVVGLSGPYDFYPFTAQRAIEAMGQYPDPQATQPLHFARADAPPMLLVTSTGDTTVRPKNAINLGNRLAELGAPVEVKNYPGINHEEVVMALSVPFRGKAPVLADSVAFLNRYLKPSAAK